VVLADAKRIVFVTEMRFSMRWDLVRVKFTLEQTMKTQVKVKQTLLRNRQVLSVSGG
jgi:hypothetical protein